MTQFYFVWILNLQLLCQQYKVSTLFLHLGFSPKLLCIDCHDIAFLNFSVKF